MPVGLLKERPQLDRVIKKKSTKNKRDEKRKVKKRNNASDGRKGMSGTQQVEIQCSYPHRGSDVISLE